MFRSLSAKNEYYERNNGDFGAAVYADPLCCGIGYLFPEFFESQGVPDFEVSVYLDAKYNDFEQYHNYLKRIMEFPRKRFIKLMKALGRFTENCKDTPFAGTYMDFDPVMRYSDYAQLREMLGYEPVKLDKGKYIVQGMPGIRDYLEGRPVKKEFEKMTLEYGGTYTEKLGVTEGLNGAYYFLCRPWMKWHKR